MASPYGILASVESSNLPGREKSAIRRWVEGVAGTGVGAVGTVAGAGIQVVRSGGESLVVGALLGAAHSEMKTGLDMKKVPMDAGIGVLGTLASLALCAQEGSEGGLCTDARNIANTGFSVFAFRKTYDLLAEKRLAAGKAPGGTFGPSQAAKVAGEYDDELDGPDDGGYQPVDGIPQQILTSEDEVDDETGEFSDTDNFERASFGDEDPIVAAAREL
jgi:hypothetical protein